MSGVVRVAGVGKSFGGRVAVSDVSFEVRRGEIFGLLGHNGAGKSTLFGMLLGMVAPDRGEAFVGGHSVRADRARALARVGAIFETPCFYDYLSGWENLSFLVSLSGRRGVDCKIREVVEAVGLEGRIHDRVRTYSHGMRQRLGLAQALLPEPEILLLDEPTDGLDPQGIHEIREMIRDLRDRHGMTVVLSSHLLPEVEQLCDRVAILRAGALVYCGAWQTGRQRWRFTGDPPDRVRAILSGLDLVAGRDWWEVPEGFDPAVAVAAMAAAGVRVRGVAPVVRTLEDFYLEVAGG
jgi:ABC-2 type transport system ATP-binding protein